MLKTNEVPDRPLLLGVDSGCSARRGERRVASHASELQRSNAARSTRMPFRKPLYCLHIDHQVDHKTARRHKQRLKRGNRQWRQ